MAKNTSPSSGTSATNMKKAASSSVGAPAQRTQSSRKGKRAWRKNVDLDEVEGGLEELRAEERATGCVPCSGYQLTETHCSVCILQNDAAEEEGRGSVPGRCHGRRRSPQDPTKVFRARPHVHKNTLATFSRTRGLLACHGKRRKSGHEAQSRHAR